MTVKETRADAKWALVDSVLQDLGVPDTSPDYTVMRAGLHRLTMTDLGLLKAYILRSRTNP